MLPDGGVACVVNDARGALVTLVANDARAALVTLVANDALAAIKYFTLLARLPCLFYKA